MCIYCGHELSNERHDPARRAHHRALIFPEPAEPPGPRPMTQEERALISAQFARADAWREQHPEPFGWAARRATV